MNSYIDEVKSIFGKTEEYAEYSQKAKSYSQEKLNEIAKGLDSIFNEFSTCMSDGNNPNSAQAIELVKKLQDYISENYYQCSDTVLNSLGQMYTADERFKSNIDRHAEGTAEFIRKAISGFCSK